MNYFFTVCTFKELGAKLMFNNYKAWWSMSCVKLKLNIRVHQKEIIQFNYESSYLKMLLYEIKL